MAPPRARDALGMRVPPAWAASAAMRLRGSLGRLHARMAPGFQLVLERLFGLVDNQALHCAVTLGLPDLLAKGPRTARELAAAAGADEDAVARLLRFLVMRGFFEHEAGRYSNNAASDVLRADHPYSWRDWVLFFGSAWNLEIWKRMGERVRTGRPAPEAALGVPFFSYLNETNPEAGKAFNGAMAAGSRVQAMLFAETVDLRGVEHACDVGGGTGSVLAHLLQVNARLRGTAFDLPTLGEQARAVFERAGVAGRASFVGGDFFERVVPGCDLYTLFAVIHDWDDEDCARILENVRKAMAPGARVMVVEGVVPPHDGEDFRKVSDMLMLVLGDGGRERTAAEFDALWPRAGLRCRRVITLPSLFKVFELEAP